MGGVVGQHFRQHAGTHVGAVGPRAVAAERVGKAPRRPMRDVVAAREVAQVEQAALHGKVGAAVEREVELGLVGRDDRLAAVAVFVAVRIGRVEQRKRRARRRRLLAAAWIAALVRRIAKDGAAAVDVQRPGRAGRLGAARHAGRVGTHLKARRQLGRGDRVARPAARLACVCAALVRIGQEDQRRWRRRRVRRRR